MNTTLRCHLFTLTMCVLVVGPLSWVVSDRKAPQWRLKGSITASHKPPGTMPHLGEGFTVTWKTTPHIRDCPGFVQIEIFDSDGDVHIKTSRKAFVPPLGSITLKPEQWVVPPDAVPGPAIYRVTSFWYCTWFERLFDWPVVQVGPDVHFVILPAEGVPYP